MTDFEIYDPPKPLSKSEEARKAELETIIDRTVNSAIEFWLAIKEYRDRRLYRIDYASFEECCQDKWDISKRQGDRLAAAGGVIENLSGTHGSHDPSTKLPFNERQARILASLDPEEQKEVWNEVVLSVQGEKVTSKLVKKVAQQLGKIKKNEPVKKVRESKDNSKLSPSFKAAFDNFLAEIQAEIDSGWKTTDKLTVKRHLRALLAAVGD